MYESLSGSWGTKGHGHPTHSLQGNKGHFGINLKEQWISLLLKETLTNKIREQLNLLKWDEGENVTFPKDQGTCYPTRRVSYIAQAINIKCLFC